MRLTTKGRFAVTAMIDLALRGGEGRVRGAGARGGRVGRMVAEVDAHGVSYSAAASEACAENATHSVRARRRVVRPAPASRHGLISITSSA